MRGKFHSTGWYEKLLYLCVHWSTGGVLYKKSASLLCASVYVYGEVQPMRRPIVMPVSPKIQKPRDSLQCFLGTARSDDRNERYHYKGCHWQSLTHGHSLQLKSAINKPSVLGYVLLKIIFMLLSKTTSHNLITIW